MPDLLASHGEPGYAGSAVRGPMGPDQDRSVRVRRTAVKVAEVGSQLSDDGWNLPPAPPPGETGGEAARRRHRGKSR
jgi:hypothetical protein